MKNLKGLSIIPQKPKKGGGISLKQSLALKTTGGVGNLAQRLKKGTDTNAMYQKTQLKNQKINTLFGIDGTGSTSGVVEEFRRSVESIMNYISEEFPKTKATYGRYDGDGHRFSSESSLLQERNRGATSNVPGFLNKAINQQIFTEKENNLAFIFGDEVFWNTYNNKPEERNEVSQKMKRLQAQLFFLWTPTGIHKFDEVKRMMIDPMGENGYIFDMQNLKMDELKEIIMGCIRFKVEKKVKKVVPGMEGQKPMTLQQYFAKKGIGAGSQLRIESGK